MSPAILVLVGIAFASQPADPKKDAPFQPGTVRVAVVNVGYVFNNWKKAQAFKSELEDAARPYNAKAKALQDDIARWEAVIKSGNVEEGGKDDYEKKITRSKRELEDLAAGMRKDLGKKSENNLVALWKEAQTAVSDHADRNGIELVFGFGDPLDKSLMDLFPNVNRKMNAMDGGAAVPMFVKGRADISVAVTEMLNKRFRGEKESAKGSRPPVSAPPEGKTDATSLPPPNFVRSRKFTLPVRADPAARADVKEFRLYVKSPKGEWALKETVGPDAEKFACTVPADGEYWYLLVAVDKQGRAQPENIKAALPHQRVVVSAGADGGASIAAAPAKDGKAAGFNTRTSAYPAFMLLADWILPPSASAVVASPRSAADFLDRGNFRWAQGRFDQAIADFGEAIRLSPDDTRPLQTRGHAFLHRREYDKAIADYSDAIRIAPKETAAYMGRAAALFRLGKFEQAFADLDTVAKLEPKSTEPYLARGMIRFSTGELAEAIAEMDGALRVDPKCKDAHYLRGRLWHARGDLAKAIVDFDAAIQLDPKDLDAYFLRGRTHGEKGDYMKAVADFTKYIEGRPTEGRGYGMRALAYLALGESAKGWMDAAKARELGEQDGGTR